MPIQPQVIETNTDLLSANLFTFEFIGLAMVSPNFNRIESMSRKVETISQADGGSGLQRKYHGGVINYEDISIVRIRDGSANDRIMNQFVTDYFATGIKRDGLFIKRHHGLIKRRIEFSGLNASAENLPTYDNATAAPEEVAYPMQCDYYEELFF